MQYKGRVSGTFYYTDKNPEVFSGIPVEFDMDPNAVDIKVKLLTSTAQMPTKAYMGDACFDIYADILNGEENGEKEIKIPAHGTVKVHTGLATEIPEMYWCPIYARSGTATNRSLRPAQGTAVIDSGYRGEWLIPLHNDSDEEQVVTHGERIAQFCVQRVYYTTLTQVGELSESQRGKGGFNSSGK